jgi:hypothetical protein
MKPFDSQGSTNGSSHPSTGLPPRPAALPTRPAFLPPPPPAESGAESPLSTGSPALGSPAIVAGLTSEDPKARARKERLEAWKREREAQKAFEEAKLRAQSVAAAHGGSGPSESSRSGRRALEQADQT